GFRQIECRLVIHSLSGLPKTLERDWVKGWNIPECQARHQSLALMRDRQKRLPAKPQRANMRGVPLQYFEHMSDARTKLEAFFTIPLTDRHHAVQRNLRPMLLIVWNDDMVHDVAVGKVFHRPAEMGSIDPEHRRALADRGGEEE